MTRSESDQIQPDPTEPMDAFSKKLYRQPIAQNTPIDLIVIGGDATTKTAAVPSAVEIVQKKGRFGRYIPISLTVLDQKGYGSCITETLHITDAELVIITSADAVWNRDILDRLLKAIQQCDVAIGARPCRKFLEKLQRTIAAELRGFMWGAGLIDPHSPYKLFRSAMIKQFPVQSFSQFAEVELIAKSNFLDALIHQEIL
ncbi:MAG: hypothetical protein RJA81_1748, partial [Planctomycetota bacterium]